MGDVALRNYFIEEVEIQDAKGNVKVKFVQEPLPAKTIWENLKKDCAGVVKRIRRRVFTNGNDEIIFVDRPDQLFGWASTKEIRPDWSKKATLLTKNEFLNYVGHVAEEYAFASALPHFPAIPKFYYIKKITPQSNGKFEDLLGFFNPATEKDKAVIKAAFMTLFWGGPFGNRPAFVFDGEEKDEEGNRGVGKTALTDAASHLINGQVDLSHKTEGPEVRKMLLTADDIRLVRFDNVKEGTLSSETLESLITAPNISGHRMYVGHHIQPNWFTYFITFNDVSLSKDLAQRAMICRLARPKYDPEWWPKVIEFIDKNRNEIISDIGFQFTVQSIINKTVTRFPTWEREVLGRCIAGSASIAQASIVMDRDAVDETKLAKEEFAEFAREKIAGMARKNPDGSTYAIKQSWVVGWLIQFLGKKITRNQASKKLKAILPNGFARETKVHDGIYYLIWNGSWHDGNFEFQPLAAKRFISSDDGLQVCDWPFQSRHSWSENEQCKKRTDAKMAQVSTSSLKSIESHTQGNLDLDGIPWD